MVEYYIISIHIKEIGKQLQCQHHTLLHWKTSPSSNSKTNTPTGSSWIERPLNLLFKLLSPQNFQPLPSQWHATIMGWWLTYLKINIVSNLFSTTIILPRMIKIKEISKQRFHLVQKQCSCERWTSCYSQRPNKFCSIQYLLRDKAKAFVWKICLVCLTQ